MTLESGVRSGIAIERLNTSHKTLEAVTNLVNTCYRSAQCWTNESKLISGLRTTPSQLLRDSQNHEIYIAYKKNQVIGCIKTGRVKSSVTGKLSYPAGYVGLLAVDPEYQSNGIGTTLVRFAEKRCSDLGLDVMVSYSSLSFILFSCLTNRFVQVMDVLSPRTDIMQWYSRLGYKPTGKSANAQEIIRGGGEKLLIPASFLVLEKRLR